MRLFQGLDLLTRLILVGWHLAILKDLPSPRLKPVFLLWLEGAWEGKGI